MALGTESLSIHRQAALNGIVDRLNAATPQGAIKYHIDMTFCGFHRGEEGEYVLGHVISYPFPVPGETKVSIVKGLMAGLRAVGIADALAYAVDTYDAPHDDTAIIPRATVEAWEAGDLAQTLDYSRFQEGYDTVAANKRFLTSLLERIDPKTRFTLTDYLPFLTPPDSMGGYLVSATRPGVLRPQPLDSFALERGLKQALHRAGVQDPQVTRLPQGVYIAEEAVRQLREIAGVGTAPPILLNGSASLGNRITGLEQERFVSAFRETIAPQRRA